MATEEWLSVTDISQRLKVREGTVRAWLREGRLTGINFGGKVGWRVRQSTFDAFLRDLEGRPDAHANPAA